MLEQKKIVQSFSAWGFTERGKMGGQFYGDCPFCEKESKFYINQKTSLWDCKKCGLSGNYQQFLEKISKRNIQALTPEDIQALATDRGLPVSAFKNHSIGIYGKLFTIPIYNEKGVLQDLRRFKPGNQMRASIGCNTGLWGVDRLVKETKLSTPVYICEGEWDGISLNWLLRYLNKPGIVVSVPGANTFKREWIPFFQDRNVFICYDNDEAGELGDLSVHQKLEGFVKSISHLYWPSKLPTGFDIRDLVSIEAVKQKKPKKTYRSFLNMFQEKPRRKLDSDDKAVQQKEHLRRGDPEKIKVQKIYDTFQKFLFLKNTDGIQIMLATVMANAIEGDPIWMFLVAPPGSAKTEIIQSLAQCEKVYAISSLTPHALISGASWVGGSDPSIIPKLKDKVLGIKDFTTIMELRENERDEIFGILRDSYDGHCTKVFGNGIKRSYESKFGIIAGVTPVIYQLDSQSQSLGERFLKFSIETNLKHSAEDEIIDRAISNINREKGMRITIAELVCRFVEWKYFEYSHKKGLPKISPEMKKNIISLAKFGSRMRGTVARDRYRSEMIDSRPSSEIGSRLGKQLAKLAQALAFVNDRKEVNEEDYRLVKKCMLDTISQRMEDMVKYVYQNCPDKNDTVNTRMVSQETKYPQSTVARCLSDMFMLEIVRRIGKSNKYEWTISPYMKKIIDEANIYKKLTEEPKKKKKRGKI